ncbi:OprD family porin [Pantoea sp. Ap-967]|uniref:OprD family porin n=1 Tax=Pantoea sp. Ap-967 TaxID=2608362 RepID=UPI0014218C36|nr:OprD family porin [Pantoea sp. Ap-967]NIE77468.1 OprD family porin [Pantoea sp. Ap-967]
MNILSVPCRAPALGGALSLGLLLAPTGTQAEGFSEDAKATLQLRTYYFNRDFKDPNAAMNKVEELAQGFILKAESGYTPGALGLGLDGIAMLGVKLDSGAGRSGSDLLPRHDDGHGADDYGRAGLALKARFSATELRYGELLSDVPVLRYDDGRLLPQTFRGAALVSREVPGLAVQAGRITAVSLRNSSDMQSLSAWSAPGITADGFNYQGLDYRFNEQRTLVGIWHAQLEDLYRQQYFNVQHRQPLGAWTLNANLGYFIDREDGSARLGTLDSRTAYGLFSASVSGHTFYLGLQKVSGDNGWMSVYGSSGRTLGNDMFNGNFSNAQERSWQVRYDYNFVAAGIPGLTLMTRYGRGSNATTQAGRGGSEWERDTELAYTVQSGSLRDLSIRLNNATNRRSFNSDFDQTRLVLSYPLAL